MRILSGMVRPHVRDQDRPVASAGSAAVDAALAICISQYLNARFALGPAAAGDFDASMNSLTSRAKKPMAKASISCVHRFPSSTGM